MVKALHRAGIEVILDVVYNHTAEGNHLGPMLSFKGIDNAAYYRLDARRPALLHGLHRHRQLAQPGPPERAAADHGLAALLGDRVPRRRLPLRPRRGAGARVLRRRPPVGVLRRDPPGPGALAGQADRRAVGRRAGRLPGRQLPGPVVGVERDLPRHDARLLARAGELSATSPRASPAPPTSTSPTAASRSPRSTSSPPTTASRCATSSPTTTSTTRPTSRTTATAPTTTARGTAAPRATTDDPEILALRARQQRNFLATLLLSQGVPMLLGGDEFGRSQHGQQQRLVPGQRALLVRLGPRASGARAARRSPARLIALRREHPVFRRAQLPRRARVDGDASLPDAWWFRPDGRKMTQRDWSDGRTARSACSSTAGRSRRRAARRAIVDDSFLLLFNAHHERSSSCCLGLAWGSAWTLELCDRRPRRRARLRDFAAHAQFELPPHSLLVLRRAQ